jgi:predicted phosphodiesterase
MREITLAGDWHGYLPHATWVAKLSQSQGIKTIFQVGDFGLWEHDRSGVSYLDDLQKVTEKYDVEIYCLAGNHDNEKLAVQLHGHHFDADGFVVLRPSVKLALRGHRWTWEDTRFLALGGAYSVDKHWRVNSEQWKTRKSYEDNIKYGSKLVDYSGTLWFPDEELTDGNVVTAIGDGSRVDVMLTHDKPRNSKPRWNRKDFPECLANQDRIQRVVDAVRPTYLVHGHLHYPYRDVLSTTGTIVYGLDADYGAMTGEPNYDRDNSVAILTLDNGMKSITTPKLNP